MENPARLGQQPSTNEALHWEPLTLQKARPLLRHSAGIS